MHAEIGAFWEVLAQQPVGVLVRAALPGAMGIAEVDGKPGVDPKVRVLRHLCPLIPGQRSSELIRQGYDRARDSLADCLGTMSSKRRSVLLTRCATVPGQAWQVK